MRGIQEGGEGGSVPAGIYSEWDTFASGNARICNTRRSGLSRHTLLCG